MSSAVLKAVCCPRPPDLPGRGHCSADKYEQPLLAAAVASMLELPKRINEESSLGLPRTSKKYYIGTARESEILAAYINDPVEIFKALAILS